MPELNLLDIKTGDLYEDTDDEDLPKVPFNLMEYELIFTLFSASCEEDADILLEPIVRVLCKRYEWDRTRAYQHCIRLVFKWSIMSKFQPLIDHVEELYSGYKWMLGDNFKAIPTMEKATYGPTTTTTATTTAIS